MGGESNLIAAGRAVVTIGLLATLTAACGVPAEWPEPIASAPPVTSTVTSSARPAQPTPAIGAVFLGGGDLHICTAAVLDAPTGDLILTAAHCLASGDDASFVAGFADEADDADIWHIDAVYLDERWKQNQDPRADFAIARVTRDAGGSVRDDVGGGLAVGQAPKPGAAVTVTGYAMGVGGGPISCTAATSDETQGFPSLPCLGLVAGLSGAPWVIGRTITGIVGGLFGGGCDESVSYSPPFDDSVGQLLARAEAGGAADDVPTVFDDNCV